jgi:hypothetical protein
MDKCISCRKEPVYIKKRGLCRNCYQRYRNENGPIIMNNPNYEYLAPASLSKQVEDREMTFVKSYFNHNNWIHKPGVLRFPPDGKYEPDFYDAERNVFIEVAGTRQAYHQNREKYERFVQHFPKLKFEIRIPTGELLDEVENMWAHQTHPELVEMADSEIGSK